MANGRKGQKVTPPASSSAASRKRWPGEGAGDAGDEGASGAAGPDDLVTIVRGLAAAVAEHHLSELVVDTPEVTFTLRRGVAGPGVVSGGVAMPAMPAMAMPMAIPSPVHAVAAPAAAAAAAAAAAPEVPPEDPGHVVTSPFVGTFYRRSNPDASEYVKLGDKVRKGQVLCIVEAMKLMNEIEADIDGTIAGILAEDSAPVEYGQPLFKIAP